MSYARFNQLSHVYVYQDVHYGLRCCWCRLISPPGGIRSWATRSRNAMVAHLEAHVAAGHKVPDDVVPALLEEIAACGDDAPGEEHLAIDRRNATTKCSYKCRTRTDEREDFAR